MKKVYLQVSEIEERLANWKEAKNLISTCYKLESNKEHEKNLINRASKLLKKLQSYYMRETKDLFFALEGWSIIKNSLGKYRFENETYIKSFIEKDELLLKVAKGEIEFY